MTSKNLFLRNAFGRRYITDKQLETMALEFTDKIKINFPDGRYDQLRLATEEVTQPVSKYLTEKVDMLSDRGGEVLNVNKMIDDFRKEGLGQVEDMVRGRYGKRSQKYAEFFPGGLTSYRQARKDDLDNLLEHLINVFTRYASDFDPTYIANINTWYNTFKNARLSEKNKKNKVSSLRSVKSEVRGALELQMYKNLLTIVCDHISNPEVPAMLFNFNMIFRSPKTKPSGTAANVFSITAAPESTNEAGIRFDDETRLNFYNDSEVPVKIYTADNAAGECPSDAIVIEPGEEFTGKAVELGKAGNRYLFVKNEDGEEEASVEITQV